MGNVQFVLGGAPVTKGKQASIKDNLYMHVNYDCFKKLKFQLTNPQPAVFKTWTKPFTKN